MAYQRLPYEQYFIDTSEDYNKTGRARFAIQYRAVPYYHSRLEQLLGFYHEVNYEIHYESERDVIQIHFQKTNGFSDWFANIFEFSGKYYDAFPFEGQPLTLNVHHGWGNMYKTIKRDIRSAWQALQEQHPGAETEIIGWSLGSGQAMLCCQDLNYNFGLRPYVYTFGSVRPFRAKKGEEQRLQRYLTGLYKDCRNFAAGNDIVTYMPPFKRFTMFHRANLDSTARTLLRLLNPWLYHTLYDRKELYTSEENYHEV